MQDLAQKIFFNIKQLCDQNNISLSRLEDILGMGRGTIIKWNTAVPRANTLKQVADYFNVSVDHLMARDDKFYDAIPEDKGLIDIQRARENMSQQDRDRMDQMLRLTFQEAFKDDK